MHVDILYLKDKFWEGTYLKLRYGTIYVHKKYYSVDYILYTCLSSRSFSLSNSDTSLMFMPNHSSIQAKHRLCNSKNSALSPCAINNQDDMWYN